MKRRAFIKKGCTACITLALAPLILESCAGTRSVTAELSDKGLQVPLSIFKESEELQSYILINEKLQFPVALFKETDKYRAFLMKCTHQGVKLDLYGDEFSCPGHGSAFDKNGEVTEGPAVENLRTFETEILDHHLLIILQ